MEQIITRSLNEGISTDLEDLEVEAISFFRPTLYSHRRLVPHCRLLPIWTKTAYAVATYLSCRLFLRDARFPVVNETVLLPDKSKSGNRRNSREKKRENKIFAAQQSGLCHSSEKQTLKRTEKPHPLINFVAQDALVLLVSIESFLEQLWAALPVFQRYPEPSSMIVRQPSNSYQVPNL